ncbi:MAG: 5-oxoprolinase subunit PxpB [Acidobacteria bacterium]|nr:5-oxoprolinase subunit PxpB [Acidobacteriota bacterium]
MRIIPLGESAMVVELGTEISPELSDKAIALATALTATPFVGFREAVPCYASVGVYFDPLEVVRDGRDAHSKVRQEIESRLDELSIDASVSSRLMEIPVDFSGPDLDEICAAIDKTRDEFIAEYCGREYRVYMLGFLPGFAYMGELDSSISFPRLPTPRLRVPKGSVGIAGRQTGIYPFESPGGWRLIGRTELELFDPNRAEPCVFRPGDRVRFVAV